MRVKTNKIIAPTTIHHNITNNNNTFFKFGLTPMHSLPCKSEEPLRETQKETQKD